MYTFQQTLQDVTVTAPLEPGTRAKTLKIDIGRQNLRVETATGQLIADGELFAPVATDESTWSVEDQKELVLTLEKTKAEWWPHVLTTDPKIDVTKIQPENSKLSDLDPETRATVEKMMFDEQQKQQGLPTSKELERNKNLEKFKALHPELDFSQLKSDNITMQ